MVETWTEFVKRSWTCFTTLRDFDKNENRIKEWQMDIDDLSLWSRWSVETRGLKKKVFEILFTTLKLPKLAVGSRWLSSYLWCSIASRLLSLMLYDGDEAVKLFSTCWSFKMIQQRPTDQDVIQKTKTMQRNEGQDKNEIDFWNLYLYIYTHINK